MTDRTPTEAAINARRRARGLTWKAIYTRARISHETLRQLRLEEPVSEDTEIAVEDVLALEHGSLAAVRHTRDPAAATPLPEPQRPDGVEGAEWIDSAQLSGGGREWRITRIIDGRPASYSIADFDHTPEAEIREELREVMDQAEIRQRRRHFRRQTS
jgi:hypothetical protein